MTKRKISEEELVSFLHQIEDGEVVLSSEENPGVVYAGLIEYAASNGWKISIFNDCNEWDYVDSIETNDGRAIDFDELPESIARYRPSHETSCQSYGIPGYLQPAFEWRHK